MFRKLCRTLTPVPKTSFSARLRILIKFVNMKAKMNSKGSACWGQADNKNNVDLGSLWALEVSLACSPWICMDNLSLPCQIPGFLGEAFLFLVP